MPSKLYCVELLGLESQRVEIEVDKLGGIPNLIIVGLPDTAVKEASERVKSAIKNSDLPFPRTKIVVNMAPADLRKMGPRYDLAIALGILATEEVVDPRNFSDTMVIGELALDGKIRPVNGILACVDFAKKAGFKRAIVPAENAPEAALIKKIEILPASHLLEGVKYLQSELCALPIRNVQRKNKQATETDMAMVRGQAMAKRALEIAAAGGHNLLFWGPPGAGKTLMAKALAGILPAMDEEEMLEVTKIYSIAGLLPKNQPLITRRPFRAIHHTASAVSIVGGGNWPNPGEISLAHHGVLFMDEIAEFPQHVLDVLRQPMESQCVTISRARGSVTYPAKFTLIAAMNPCPCGYHNTTQLNRTCVCTAYQVQRYQKRLSGPLLDRIDMHIGVQPVEHNQLMETSKEENSRTIRQRVEKATQMQRERFRRQACRKNAEMGNDAIAKFCELDSESKKLLSAAANHMALSARGAHRIIKMARTIADLEQAVQIRSQHIAEALQYRSRIF